MSLDREPKGIQWPPQEELAADADVPAVASEKKVRQKYVRIFFWHFYDFMYKLYSYSLYLMTTQVS